MKKLLFAANTLDIGGIETSLITLLNYLDKEKYDITLILEKKQGIFLNDIDKNIKILEYKPSENKVVLIRKIINLLKRIKFILKYKNKFDFAASYATYSLVDSFVARTASKNSVLWVHGNYLTFCENNIEKFKSFFNSIKVEEFKNIIFVSKESKDIFSLYFKALSNKTIFCNNLINYKKVEKLSKEKIDIDKNENIITFLNIGRHEEFQKRLTRVIKASQKLKFDNYKFKVLFIGDGPDTKNYKKMVKDFNLEDTIIFLGRKKNPYPYFKLSDCVIITSEYEGYPVVFLESMVLQIPIITTEVSDYQQIDNKYGIVTKKDIDNIYFSMKKFIQEGFEIKEKFDVEKYNNEIITNIEKLFI